MHVLAFLLLLNLNTYVTFQVAIVKIRFKVANVVVVVVGGGGCCDLQMLIKTTLNVGKKAFEKIKIQKKNNFFSAYGPQL